MSEDLVVGDVHLQRGRADVGIIGQRDTVSQGGDPQR